MPCKRMDKQHRSIVTANAIWRRQWEGVWNSVWLKSGISWIHKKASGILSSPKCMKIALLDNFSAIVKTTPQKTRFHSVNNYKEFTYRWKVHIREQWRWLKWWHECAEQQAQEHVERGRKPEACERARVHHLKTCECPLFCSVSLVSSSFDSLHITLWLKWAQGLEFFASFIPQSSPCPMRTLSDSLSSTSPFHSRSFSSIIFSFQHFLLLFTFFEVSSQQPCALPLSRVLRTTSSPSQLLKVVDNKPAHFRWGAWHPGREELLHRLWAQRPLHHGDLCRVHPESLSEQRFPEDFDYDDVTIGKALLNPLPKTSRSRWRFWLSSCLSSSMSHDRKGKPVVCRDTRHEPGYEIQRQNSGSEQIGLSWTDKAIKSSLIVKGRFENTKSRPIMTEEVYKNWMKWSSRSKKNFIVLEQKNEVDKIINFFMKNYWNKIGIFVKFMRKASVKWKKLKRFQCSPFDTIARRKIGRSARYYPWTHRQDRGMTEWN